ncbi:MAG: CotH protein [Pedosphaera sp.]|nr:CotH protein [Pedosphaera sp.]
MTTENQNSPVPFTPTWIPTTHSLINGMFPSGSSGDFQLESAGGLSKLTDGAIGPAGTGNGPFATAGNNGSSGQFVIYTLPASTNGYNLTNITVYSGWADNGRDAQRYVVSYATIAQPASFIPLGNVDYNPPVAVGIPTANRVILGDATGAPIAANVVALKFDFTPGVENGYAGYSEITVEGTVATNAATSFISVTTQNQHGGASFTPTWIIETDSLISGQAPSSVGSGSFANEPGVTGIAALTDGTFGLVDNKSSYATCGSLAGQSVSYFLNGADITNIVVYSGWPDTGRDGQFYNVFYSTLSNASSFILLTSVYYNPPVSGLSANRVAITTTTHAPLATNVAFLKFDFTAQDAGTENGYSGYAEIIVEGTNAAPSATAAVKMSPSPTSIGNTADAVLVFNEIMYHPATNEAGMEWIELYNQLAVDVDVSGWRLGGDSSYAFPNGTRVAGRSYIVLARDPAQLQAATGLSSNVFGPFVSPLNNQGGTLELYNNSGRLMDRLTFGTDGDWPVTPDGAGPSLAKLDRDWGGAAAANWTASRQSGGTPGADNFVSSPPPVTVAFNEISGTASSVFWLELMNYGTNLVSLANCIIHHDGVTNTDHLLPPDLTLAPGAFMVLSNNVLGFLSPASGEKLFLFTPDKKEVYDGLVLKKSPRARFPDGTGAWLVPNLPTPGASNSFAFHAELVINEIMYNHKDFPAANTNQLPSANPEEWLELYNRGPDTVDLTGWSLAGGIKYAFGPVKTIAPGGYLVVARDALALRAIYPAVDIVGNYSGQLGNGDHIILADPLGNPANQLHYYSGGRWSEFPGGGGSSLELRDPGADNSQAEAWAPSIESGKSSWQTFTYRMVAQPSATSGPDDRWHDFILGLLSDGECWVDDLSVVASPTNNPVQLITNGNFESGLNGWRLVGNHQRSVLEPDPDSPGNHILHVVASGPQEHLNNHIETTLAGGRAVTNGVLYEISYRARWITGNHLLNTRLYFNRGARTMALPVPQRNGTPGAVNSRYSPNIGPTFSQFQHQPVVPQPQQPVSVFAVVQDPQGVAACAAWWSVNGGAWSNSPMQLTNGAFKGTIPGLPINSLVQFYVRAVDGLGAVSTFPARGANAGAFYRVYDGLANVPLAHNLRILMSPANFALQYATTNLMSNENLPCTVIYDERQAYYDMAVRLKSSERGRVAADRIGFHLEFNPHDLFRGVHPVLLVDRSGGGTRPALEEIVLKHMAVHAGVPELNSDLCRVIAPQSAQNGMAILCPRYEDNFIGGAFTNGGNGSLFEYELTYYPGTADAGSYKLPSPDSVQGADFSDLGGDKEAYRYNFILKNHRSVDDYSTLVNLAKICSLNVSALDTQTRPAMDLDEWLSAYAIVSLCGVGDMYTFGGNHNLIAYVRPDDGKVLYFPWDMDFSFSQAITAPLVGDQNLSRIINLPANLRRLYAHMLDDINTTFNPAYMTYWASHYGSFSGQDYSGDLAYIQQRGSYAISTINSAGGNSPFAVNGTNSFSVSSNLVTLTGTAPVQITSILINGVRYPVTWTSVSAWTIQVPVGSPTNLLNIQGFDLHGNLLTNSTATVVFTGTVPVPANIIVFNEIMYNPGAPEAEFVELLNTSPDFTFDLSGWRINGLSYTFPPGSILAPKALLVLAKDRVAFAIAYGNTLPVFDQFDGNLDADGETLTLFMPDPAHGGQEVAVNRVRYEAATPWPVITNGASLQLIDPTQDNSRVANWLAVPALASLLPQPQWVRASATGIPRPDVTRPLYIYLQSAGDIYIDDVSVVAGSVAETGVNVVSNGGFETSLVPWTIGSDGNNGASLISNNVKHSGNTSLHLVAAAAGSTQNSAIWQDFSGNLTPGATYTLSFWYLQSTNGGPLTVRFSGNGLTITTNPAPMTLPLLAAATPAAANSVTATLPAFPAVWLNELQTGNVTGPTNNFGARVPWVELYNPGTNALSLTGLCLSDNYSNLTRWAFPANVSVPANGFLVVWCDGQTNQSTSTSPHASFTLASSGGSVVLSRLLNIGVPQIVDYLNYTNLPSNWSYGDFPDGQPFSRQQMFTVTAGAPNSQAASPITISINEWMADSTHTLANPVGGKFDDWFELYNYGTNTVDLGGYYLTGTLTNKAKFLIPNTHQHLVPAKGFTVIWADNGNASNSTNRPELHVNFKLSKAGDSIGLFAADGTAIDVLTFGAQATDVSEGRFPDGAPDIFSMPVPTPQTNNAIPNRPPVLVSIPDKYVHAGQAVQFIATATDADNAYQTLTFSLTNSPADAGINPSTGAFFWLTTNAVVPSTNSVTLRVSDNGIPPLGDVKTFFIVAFAQPRFSSVIGTTDSHVQISFNTLPNQHYQVQFKNELTDATWLTLGGSVFGNGAPATIFDDMTARPQRFYRLLAYP